MGYSCSTKSMNVLMALFEEIKKAYGDLGSSNSWKKDGRLHFYEVGRENRDGAVTGSVWREIALGDVRVRKMGSFRIEPDGKVKKFPGAPKSLKEKAEMVALDRKELWAKATEFDRIDPASKFVMFSGDNPYAKLLDETRVSPFAHHYEKPA